MADERDDLTLRTLAIMEGTTVAEQRRQALRTYAAQAREDPGGGRDCAPDGGLAATSAERRRQRGPAARLIRWEVRSDLRKRLSSSHRQPSFPRTVLNVVLPWIITFAIIAVVAVACRFAEEGPRNDEPAGPAGDREPGDLLAAA